LESSNVVRGSAQTNLSAEDVRILVAEDPLNSQFEVVINEVGALKNLID